MFFINILFVLPGDPLYLYNRLIDIYGRVRVKPVYDKIHKYGTLDANFTIIEKKNKEGLINGDGVVLYKPKFDKMIKKCITFVNF
jgi:hypothetical protein